MRREREGRPQRGDALRALPRSPSEVRTLLQLVWQLDRLGWLNSTRQGKAVDGRGRPIPWLTYPATRWLEAALRQSDLVLEFGSGQSTHWLAERVERVVAVEHDETWATTLRHAARVEVHRVSPSPVEAYLQPFRALVRRPDVILIDGLHRAACLSAALPVLANDGAIVLDDADRPDVAEGLAHASQAGFSRVDFYGPRPGLGYLSTTSVLFVQPSTRLHPANAPRWSGY